MISIIYLANLSGFKAIRVRAVADIILEKAQKMAQDYNIEKACSVDEVLDDPSIELIVNLTVPKAHAEVTLRGITAGKHVYGEKPLATNREDGKKILEAARSKGVRVGSAPDTFLGGSFKLQERFWMMVGLGSRSLLSHLGQIMGQDEHPNAAFFYQKGGDPCLTWSRTI